MCQDYQQSSPPPSPPMHTLTHTCYAQVRRLREAGKSVVASVCNVAASGGYYIAMGCETIVCDELSITGSIGVVQAKFAIGELIEKVRGFGLWLYFLEGRGGGSWVFSPTVDDRFFSKGNRKFFHHVNASPGAWVSQLQRLGGGPSLCFG